MNELLSDLTWLLSFYFLFGDYPSIYLILFSLSANYYYMINLETIQSLLFSIENRFKFINRIFILRTKYLGNQSFPNFSLSIQNIPDLC